MNLIVMGISTGGPRTLARVFNNLPRLKAGLVMVQHMPAFINHAFCKTLSAGTDMDVILAEQGMAVEPGCVLVAPSECHLELVDNRRVRLVDGEKVNYVRPAVDVTMLSLRRAPALRAVGVVMTGLGRDGADGIAHIHDIGGVTIAQDEESSVIFGMPGAAIETGKVDHVLPPEGIRRKIVELAGVLAEPRIAAAGSR
jgi:two-component system chemotaxis response regulator CheB